MYSVCISVEHGMVCVHCSLMLAGRHRILCNKVGNSAFV